MQTELEKFGEAISYISDALHYPFLQENKVRSNLNFWYYIKYLNYSTRKIYTGISFQNLTV